MNQFGDFLTNLRSSRGLTLEALAILVGSSKSTLSRLENDDVSRPYKGAIRKLIIHLAQVLCTSRKETERFLTIAKINTSLLTEDEQKLLGFTPSITNSTPLEPRNNNILVLNFAHPISEQQRAQIEKLVDTTIVDIITIPTHFQIGEPLQQQILRLLDELDLLIHDWYKRYILINPPGYAPAAFLLLAELHGRIGHFPSLIQLRPVPGPVTTYEVAELLNLQTIRETARRRR